MLGKELQRVVVETVAAMKSKDQSRSKCTKSKAARPIASRASFSAKKWSSKAEPSSKLEEKIQVRLQQRQMPGGTFAHAFALAGSGFVAVLNSGNMFHRCVSSRGGRKSI